MYSSPDDECKVVCQQKPMSAVGECITLKSYRVYPDFLKIYYVVEIDGVEWFKTYDPARAHVMFHLLAENNFSEQLKQYEKLSELVSDHFKQKYREEYKDEIQKNPSITRLEEYL